LLTHVIAFIIGTAAGAAGGYFASRFTDVRRAKESQSALEQQFREVELMMPDLIAEMREDFRDPELRTIRELVVLPNQRVIFNSKQKRFAYFEDSHDDLSGKMAVLENHGYIVDVTPGNTPIYRLTEEFVVAVRK
jgi:hypothetical protein